MNINFKTHFPWPGRDGKPEATLFREKILSHVDRIDWSKPFDAAAKAPENLPPLVLSKQQVDGDGDLVVANLVSMRKIHTIRRWPLNGKPRYREGMKLTFSQGPRFKPVRFGETVCTGVQDLKMGAIFIGPATMLLICTLDGRDQPMGREERITLALNDGLTPEQFNRLFLLDVLQNGPGAYRIIHWSETRY